MGPQSLAVWCCCWLIAKHASAPLTAVVFCLSVCVGLSACRYVRTLLDAALSHPVSALCVDDVTGNIFVAAGPTIIVTDVNGACLATAVTTGAMVTALTFGRSRPWWDAQMVATGRDDGGVDVWSLEFPEPPPPTPSDDESGGDGNGSGDDGGEGEGGDGSGDAGAGAGAAESEGGAASGAGADDNAGAIDNDNGEDDDGGADDDNYLDDADNRRFQFLQHGYTSSFTLGRGSVLAPDSPMSGVSEATSGSYASSAQPVEGTSLGVGDSAGVEEFARAGIPGPVATGKVKPPGGGSAPRMRDLGAMGDDESSARDSRRDLYVETSIDAGNRERSPSGSSARSAGALNEFGLPLACSNAPMLLKHCRVLRGHKAPVTALCVSSYVRCGCRGALVLGQ